MKFDLFKRSPASLTDEELEQDRLRREWEAEAERERERRAEARRVETERKAAEEAEAARLKECARLTREHERAVEETQRAHAHLGQAIVAAGSVVEERDAARARAFAAQEALVQLGERKPVLELSEFARGVALAAQRLAPVLAREAVVNPLRDAVVAAGRAPAWADPFAR